MVTQLQAERERLEFRTEYMSLYDTMTNDTASIPPSITYVLAEHTSVNSQRCMTKR